MKISDFLRIFGPAIASSVAITKSTISFTSIPKKERTNATVKKYIFTILVSVVMLALEIGAIIEELEEQTKQLKQQLEEDRKKQTTEKEEQLS